MRIRNAFVMAGAAVLALAAQLTAGGFGLVTLNPADNPAARKMNAVIVFQTAGCHNPETAKVTATAIGLVNGEQRSIPLKLTALGEPGLYGVARQWPKEGRWVIQLLADNDSLTASLLLRDGPDGIDRHTAVAGGREFSKREIEVALRD